MRRTVLLWRDDGGKLSDQIKHCRADVRRLVLLTMSCIIAISCAGPKPIPNRPAEEKFRNAMVEYEKRKYDEAKRLFESVIFDSPGSVVADSAQYLVGMCYYHQDEYELAAAEFQRFFTQFPTSPLVDDAELMRARCYYYGGPKNTGLDQNYTRNSVNILLAFKDDHPNSDLLPAADSLLSAAWERLSIKDFKAGKLYQRMRAYRAAQVYFQLVLDQFPESPLVPEALYLMGETYRRLEIYDTAQVWYEKLIYLYPDAKYTEDAQKRVRDLQPLLPESTEGTRDEEP